MSPKAPTAPPTAPPPHPGGPALRQLHKLTTRYDPAQDRIALLAQDAAGTGVLLWLTQRMLQRLVPALVERLEGGAGSPASGIGAQAFVQAEAVARMQPLAPVVAQPEQSDTGDAPARGALVLRIALGRTARGAHCLVLHCDSGPPAELVLEAVRLRQWLAVLHRHCTRAGWRMPGIWPDWISPALSATPAGGQQALH